MTDNILGRDDILNTDDDDLIEVEAFGGVVLVKPLSGDERDRYEASNWRRDPKTGQLEINTRGARARLAAMGIVDRDGKRLFDPKSKQDLRALGAKPAHELDKITEAIRTASGISDDHLEEQVEDFDEDEAEPVGAASSSA